MGDTLPLHRLFLKSGECTMEPRHRRLVAEFLVSGTCLSVSILP